MGDDQPDPREQAVVLRQAAEEAVAEQGKWQMLADRSEHEVAEAIADNYASVWNERASEIQAQLEDLQRVLEGETDA